MKFGLALEILRISFAKTLNLKAGINFQTQSGISLNFVGHDFTASNMLQNSIPGNAKKINQDPSRFS